MGLQGSEDLGAVDQEWTQRMTLPISIVYRPSHPVRSLHVLSSLSEIASKKSQIGGPAYFTAPIGRRERLSDARLPSRFR